MCGKLTKNCCHTKTAHHVSQQILASIMNKKPKIVRKRPPIVTIVLSSKNTIIGDWYTRYTFGSAIKFRAIPLHSWGFTPPTDCSYHIDAITNMAVMKIVSDIHYSVQLTTDATFLYLLNLSAACDTIWSSISRRLLVFVGKSSSGSSRFFTGGCKRQRCKENNQHGPSCNVACRRVVSSFPY